MGNFDEALKDAEAAVDMQPDWPKGYYRKAMALRGLHRHEEALLAFLCCAAFDQQLSPEISQAMQEVWSFSFFLYHNGLCYLCFQIMVQCQPSFIVVQVLYNLVALIAHNGVGSGGRRLSSSQLRRSSSFSSVEEYTSDEEMVPVSRKTRPDPPLPPADIGINPRLHHFVERINAGLQDIKRQSKIVMQSVQFER